MIKIIVQESDIDSLFKYLKDSGLDMQSMSQTVMGNVENFIIREKIGNASLSVAEVNAFYELADRGLAEFRLDAKDKSGFLISPLDVNVVENGVDAMTNIERERLEIGQGDYTIDSPISATGIGKDADDAFFEGLVGKGGQFIMNERTEEDPLAVDITSTDFLDTSILQSP